MLIIVKNKLVDLKMVLQLLHDKSGYKQNMTLEIVIHKHTYMIIIYHQERQECDKVSLKWDGLQDVCLPSGSFKNCSIPSAFSFRGALTPFK